MAGRTRGRNYENPLGNRGFGRSTDQQRRVRAAAIRQLGFSNSRTKSERFPELRQTECPGSRGQSRGRVGDHRQGGNERIELDDGRSDEHAFQRWRERTGQHGDQHSDRSRCGAEWPHSRLMIAHPTPDFAALRWPTWRRLDPSTSPSATS
jgi:hypothetical protein